MAAITAVFDILREVRTIEAMILKLRVAPLSSNKFRMRGYFVFTNFKVAVDKETERI